MIVYMLYHKNNVTYIHVRNKNALYTQWSIKNKNFNFQVLSYANHLTDKVFLYSGASYRF